MRLRLERLDFFRFAFLAGAAMTRFISRFAMIETEIVFGAQAAFLDRPSQSGSGGQFRQRGFGWPVGKVRGDGVGIAQATAHQ